jgi:hypothetical protein
LNEPAADKVLFFFEEIQWVAAKVDATSSQIQNPKPHECANHAVNDARSGQPRLGLDSDRWTRCDVRPRSTVSTAIFSSSFPWQLEKAVQFNSDAQLSDLLERRCQGQVATTWSATEIEHARAAGNANEKQPR